MELSTEEKLKSLIVERYGTMIDFARKINMSNSTLASIITRGIHNASVNNIIKICSALNISADGLADGKIVSTDTPETSAKTAHDIKDIFSHIKMNINTYDNITIDGETLSKNDIADILDGFDLMLEFIRRRHGRK